MKKIMLSVLCTTALLSCSQQASASLVPMSHKKVVLGAVLAGAGTWIAGSYLNVNKTKLGIASGIASLVSGLIFSRYTAKSCLASGKRIINSERLFESSCDGRTGSCKKKSKKRTKKVAQGGDWIVKVDGEAVIYGDAFEKEFSTLLEEKPQLKAMLPLMPDLKKNFASGLGNQEAIALFVHEKGLDETVEYAEKKERADRAVMQMLNVELFTKAFETASLSEEDLKKFYEENKDVMQGILISRGGVETVGVSFDKKTDAESFYTQAKEAGKNLDLQKLAKKAGVSDKVRDFKVVNGQSFSIDPVLRTKIMGLKKFPTVELLAGENNSFWVINARSKEESQYRPFDQVREGVKNVAEQTQKARELQLELDKLVQTYNIEINEQYFQSKTVAATESAAPDINKLLAQQIQQLPKTKTA